MLPPELLIEVYQHTQHPISLILVNKWFHQFFTHPTSKSKWALTTFGKIHALPCAILLGKTFATIDVIKSLLDSKANLSRYFIQRLYRQFQEANQTSWTSDISFELFSVLINVSKAKFELNPLEHNDMEKFRLLTSGKLPINLEEIRDLIVNQKFTPFPPRAKIPYSDTHNYFRKIQIINQEEYGYENNEHLFAGAIFLESRLVDIWKKIGYHDICRDFNNLVIQECILKLFPSPPPNGWHYPTKKDIVDEFKRLIGIGFKLTKSAMVDILCFRGSQLDIINDSVLIESFCEVRRDPETVIIQKCLIEITTIDREIDNSYKVLDFLINNKNGSELEFIFLDTIIYHLFDTKTRLNYEDYVSKSSQVKPPKKMDNELPQSPNNNNNDDYFTDLLNKYQDLLYNKYKYKEIKNHNIENPINGIRMLTLRSSLYSWILKKFGPNSMVTKLCFYDIILSKVWIDVEKQHHPERDITAIVRGSAIDNIILIYEDFCKNYVPFETHHADLLKKSSENLCTKRRM